MNVADCAPFDLFAHWLDAAQREEPNDPNAMTLATVADRRPSARMVLLKGMDAAEMPDRGFVFYTNLQSRKSDELGADAQAALVFHWKSLRRQVRIEGACRQVSSAESDAYYATRPRLSRLGAWASDQSRPLDSRATLERRLATYDARFVGEEIPRPSHWGGWRLVPAYFEFWQDMPFRLHDRATYSRVPDGWQIGRLFP